MAKQTDGGRRREAHDTGKTIIISVISSNHGSTAAFPSLSVCYTHQHKPTAKCDSGTCCTLNSSALNEVLTLVKFLFHVRCRGEHFPASPASPPSPEQAAPCAYRRVTKLGSVLMSTEILHVALNKTPSPVS